MAFETVENPVGAFIGWGKKPGQYVEGIVVLYGEEEGDDYAGNPCPEIEVVLTKPAASFNKELQRTDYPEGETVIVTCGLTSLKKHIKRANPKRGNMIRIELKSLDKVPNGEVKVFDIKIDRKIYDIPGAAGVSGSDDESGSVSESNLGGTTADDDEPPF